MITAALLAALVGLAGYGLVRYVTPQWLSPDGQIYIVAGRSGDVPPRPFHLRWLLPVLCRGSHLRWRIASALGLIMATAGVAALASGLGLWRAVTAAALFAGLPLYRTTAELPALVDGPALAFTVWSAALASHGHIVAGVALAVIGAAVKETVPVFAAAAAWCPWLLVGVVVPVVIAVLRKPSPSMHESQLHPFRYGRAMHGVKILDPYRMLLPWGVCLAALWLPTPALLVSLALGYGMLLVSADMTRIYQWAALPMCVQAAAVLPVEWLLPAVAVHTVWPWRGEGEV